MFTFTRLYSDWAGESHFDDVQVNFASVDYMDAGPPLNLSAITNASSMRFMEAPAGWTSDWQDPQPQPLAGVGDEAFVVQRNTSWEVAPGQPMTEVLLGFRRCNVSAVILLAAMPQFDPVMQATRYANIIIGKVA